MKNATKATTKQATTKATPKSTKTEAKTEANTKELKVLAGVTSAINKLIVKDNELSFKIGAQLIKAKAVFPKAKDFYIFAKDAFNFSKSSTCNYIRITTVLGAIKEVQQLTVKQQVFIVSNPDMIEDIQADKNITLKGLENMIKEKKANSTTTKASKPIAPNKKPVAPVQADKVVINEKVQELEKEIKANAKASAMLLTLEAKETKKAKEDLKNLATASRTVQTKNKDLELRLSEALKEIVQLKEKLALATAKKTVKKAKKSVKKASK